MKTKFNIDQLVFVKLTTGWIAQKIKAILIKKDMNGKLLEEYVYQRTGHTPMCFYANLIVATIQEVNSKLSEDKKRYLDQARKSMKELAKELQNENKEIKNEVS